MLKRLLDGRLNERLHFILALKENIYHVDNLSCGPKNMQAV